LEGDALLVILAVNQSRLFSTWQFAFIVSGITLDFLFILKLERFEIL
jgi:hypothetical protein